MKTITLTLVLLHLLAASCTPQYTGYNYALGYQAVIAPADDIPDLKDCSPEAPCQYSDGDCTRHGDDGCDSDLVCGVNNCGDFVPGMAGSCCAQLESTTYTYSRVERYGEYPRQWTSWGATQGGWGRQRSRVLTAWNGTQSYQWEDQEFN